MIISNTIKEFKEKYDREAIQSIINLSDDKTLYRSTFTGFNITESVEQFKSYIEGFAEYRVTEGNKNEKRTNEILLEHTKLLLENKSDKANFFKEIKVPYNSATEFIQEYMDSITIVSDMINSSQSIIMESTDDVESTGYVVTFTEMFMEKMNDAFYPIMEHLLQSSGYYSRKQLRQPPAVKEKTEQHFFL